MIDVSPELIDFLKSEYDRCEDETLDDERETAIKRYNGEPYGDEIEGSSQVVARDTAEVVDYMAISILRTIVSGDRVVEFTHSNHEAAHQATETIMHLLMDEQDGYRVIHDWLKAGLLEKNAVAMTYAEPQQPKRVELNGVSAMALMQFQQQGLEIIEAEPVEAPEGPEGPIFNVAGKQPQPPKFCDAAVPNEEFYCSPDARTITEAPLKGRRRIRTVYDLAEEGIKPDDLIGLGDAGFTDGSLANARDEGRNTDIGARTGMARGVWWHEEYARFDENGDGIAELLYIRRDANFNIYSIEAMDDPDDHPFEDWSPFPMQHRRIGQSLFDKVGDIERIRTVLLRQSLNGIYVANNPSTYVHEDAIGENTIEDLLNVRPGRIIRWKGPTPPVERSGAFNGADGFTMLEFMNGERESRTGITRLNQGLDADALNKTATGTALMQAQGQQVEEYVGRNFANGLARMFTKKAKLLGNYYRAEKARAEKEGRQPQSLIVPIDGKYVPVDPSTWPEDMIARPRVGLGSSRKEQRIAYRRELIGMQAQAQQAGLPIVDASKFYNSAKGFVADAGLGDVGEYFNDPSNLPPQEPKPDPEMAKVQAQIEAEKMKLQMKQQESAAKLGLQQAEAQARIQMMQQQGATQAQINAQKAMADNQLAQMRAMAEAQLAERQIQIDAMLKQQELAAKARREDQKAAAVTQMAKFRPGGSLAA